MDSETEDLYLQKLEEFVYDEDKIVTVRWLSITLGIKITDAKHLVQKYLSDQRTNNSDALGVTYVLSGMIEEDTLSICLAKEEELEHKKDELIKVLNQQIYSIQKSKQIDLTAVSLVDCFDTHHPLQKPVPGSLISKKCVKRVLKEKKPLPPPPAPTLKGKSSFFVKKTNSSSSNSSSSSVSVKEENSSPLRNGTTKPASKGSSKSKQNGIANFFSKASSTGEIKERKVIAEPEPEIKEEPEVKEETESKQDIQSRIFNLVDNDSDAENIISPTPQPSLEKKRSKPRQKRQKKNNENLPNPKRRKRIVEHNDSDSDDIFGDDSVKEDIVLSSDEEPKLVLKQPLAPKNKKRKQVTQTFEDADGYIVTSKEWVEASGSEEEVEVVEPELKKAKPETKLQEVKQENNEISNGEKQVANNKPMNGKGKGAKNKKPVAANQKTLMSFFVKK